MIILIIYIIIKLIYILFGSKVRIIGLWWVYIILYPFINKLIIKPQYLNTRIIITRITMAKIKAIIYKEPRATGSGFAFFVPKALFDCKVLEKGKTYKVIVEELPAIPAFLRQLRIWFLGVKTCY